MEFPVVALVRHMRLEDLVEPRGRAMVHGVVVGDVDRDVVDRDPDEGVSSSWLCTHPHVVAIQLDKVDHDVEGGEAEVGVELCDISSQRAFGFIVDKRVVGVINQPQRHGV